MYNTTKKQTKLENKIKAKKDFLNWNKNFTKKVNVAALYVLGINVLMAISVTLYGTGILPTLSAIKLFYKMGIYGAICGAGVVGTTILLNTALALNRIYLKTTNKHLNQKLEEINHEEFIDFSKQESKTLEEQKSESNQLTLKNSEVKPQSYKYNFDSNQQQNYTTSSMSPVDNQETFKKTKIKKRIVSRNDK